MLICSKRHGDRAMVDAIISAKVILVARNDETRCMRSYKSELLGYPSCVKLLFS